MTNRNNQWDVFIKEINNSGRFKNALLTPPDHGENIASISGEVESSSAHDDIVAMAKQRGFLLIAQNLSIPCHSE